VAWRNGVGPDYFRIAEVGDVVRREDTLRVDGTSSRRSFLIGAVLALSGGTSAAWIFPRRGHGVPRWLRQLVPDMNAAAAIGRRYLRTRPSEASPAWLAERLLGASAPDVLHGVDLVAVRRRLRSLRLADFQSGDLVFIDGWALTRTEARLMALVAACATS
jgi:hypothetical protein